MHRGYVKYWRKSMDHHLYFKETFTKWQAWMDLVLLANHKLGYVYKNDVRITIERGQLGWSKKELAERWKWSRGKVDRFFSGLELDKQIVQQTCNVTTLITIINYETYATGDTSDSTPDSTTDGHRIVQRTGTNKNVKNVKNKEESAQAHVSFPLKKFFDFWVLTKEPKNTVVESFRDYLISGAVGSHVTSEMLIEKLRDKNYIYKDPISLVERFDKASENAEAAPAKPFVDESLVEIQEKATPITGDSNDQLKKWGVVN